MEDMSPAVLVVLIVCSQVSARNIGDNLSSISDSILKEVHSVNEIEETTKHWTVEEKIKTWVHVCCPPSQYFKNNSCIEGTEPVDDLVLPKIYTADKQASNMTAEDFQQVYHNPCPVASFVLLPEFDDIYLLENGTIIMMLGSIPSLLINQNRYCLAKLKSKVAITVIAVCDKIMEDHPPKVAAK